MMNIGTLVFSSRDYILRRWTTEHNGTTGAAVAAVVFAFHKL